MIRLAVVLALALVLLAFVHQGLQSTGRRVLTEAELVAKYGIEQVENSEHEYEDRGGLTAREHWEQENARLGETEAGK